MTDCVLQVPVVGASPFEQKQLSVPSGSQPYVMLLCEVPPPSASPDGVELDPEQPAATARANTASILLIDTSLSIGLEQDNARFARPTPSPPAASPG